MSESQKNIDYWIACSGGVDSVVLVHLFKEMNKNFGILYCNFNLRGVESKEDEIFVRALARELDVIIQVKHFETKNYIEINGGNTQIAARELRYSWFEEIKRTTKAKIVLGHHKDDQIETFFLQLRRGGKLRGLSCMPYLFEDYVRPLLNYSKEEIYQLANQNNWKWREDSSNRKNNYKRNIYRNEWIPYFVKNNLALNQVVDLISSFQSILKYTENYFKQNFNFDSDIDIPFNIWNSWPKWMKHEFLRLFNNVKYSVEEVERLKKSQKGKYLGDFDLKIWSEGDHFKFQKRVKPTKIEFEIKVEKIENRDIHFNQKCLYLNAEKVGGDLRVRKWRNSDFFMPLGMKGKKSISKFLRDKKVDSSLKKEIPILVDVKDNILGVFGFCTDERYRVLKETKLVLKVTLKN